MKPTPEDRQREPFRWCVFCDADCEASEDDHADDCPQVTGIWPVRPHKHCASCTCDGTIMCCDCGAELRVGDSYMHREIEPAKPLIGGMAGAGVYDVICVGCAAKDALT